MEAQKNPRQSVQRLCVVGDLQENLSFSVKGTETSAAPLLGHLPPPQLSYGVLQQGQGFTSMCIWDGKIALNATDPRSLSAT